MSIRTNELQQIIAPQSEDSILLESAAAGTGQLTMTRAAEFFDQELLKPGTQLSTSLSQNAPLSAILAEKREVLSWMQKKNCWSEFVGLFLE